MFDEIVECFEVGSIPSFWHTNYNLIGNLKEVQINDLKFKLIKLRNKLRKELSADNPNYLIELLRKYLLNRQ